MSDVEINYDAGRMAASYERNDLYESDFPNFVKQGSYLCLSDTIIQRYRYCQKTFDELLKIYAQILSVTHPSQVTPSYIPGDGDWLMGRPTELYEYRLLSENWVYQMRRTIDSLVQLSALHANQIGELSVKIEPDGIGRLLGKDGNKFSIYPIFLGSERWLHSDDTDFLGILNDLFNSMKHCVAHEESHPLFCRECPTVVSFYSRHNDFRDGYKYHNHNAYHLMMGFQDCVARVLKNLCISTDSK